ncbi:hypothetical protein BDZ89DRAFT_1108647 [Hymenopellis radicata]|nr:hypothetical protein BDZ89DRAFT_1108647 [Hymenopellis radicata]
MSTLTMSTHTESDPQVSTEAPSIGAGGAAEMYVLTKGPIPSNRNSDGAAFRCEEPAEPICIGAGSFAEIYVISGGPIAYKQMFGSDGAALRFEYDALSVIYQRCHDSQSFFAIPRPFAFNDPSGLIAFHTTSPIPLHRRPRPVRPIVNQALLSIFRSPVYAMDRVQALPPRASAKLTALYFPRTVETGPLLCRLYFGKTFTGARIPSFYNTQNFPLDEGRYNTLASLFPRLPSVTEVVQGMAEMLARLHYRASMDARDVEFVLGGDGGSGFTFFVIDFNQVRYWPKTLERIDELVSAFFANDPYYPRPRPSDPLYVAFKEAYLAECTDDVADIGQAFIAAIEAEQVGRDVRSATSASSSTPPLDTVEGGM